MIRKLVLSTLLALGFLSVWAQPARAHCDTMDGPVVRAAQKALETGELEHVLIWVPAEGEPEIREAFAQVRAVRLLGPQARELADRYFFETVVRIHRAGEGAPYTGLKPAGQGITPAIRLADQALEEGSSAKLEAALIGATRGKIRERFARALERKSFTSTDVPAGRKFIGAYVEFIHFVEEVEKTVTGGSDVPHSEAGTPAHAHP